MKNKLDFYSELISSILDCCCSYIVTVENIEIELISCYGNNPFDLDTLRLVVNRFDTTKKSFSILDIKDFENTIENKIFSSNNLDSIGYLPILDINKIAIGYLITVFNQPFGIIENQENTVSLITNKIAEQLLNDVKEEDLNMSDDGLLSQTDQKATIVEELIRANKELTFKNAEKEKQANELINANQELAFQIQEQEKRAAELLIANLEIDFLHQEEHALFTSIVDSSDDAMVSERLDGIITSWNHGAEKIFGYNADEIIGKSIATLIPQQLQQEEVGIIEKIKKGETISNLKTQRVRKDGTIFYSALTISPIKNLDGIVIGASKVLRDITEQYNSEVEKNQIAERFRLATQSAQIGVWDWDLQTNKLASDEGMYKLYGIASEDFNSVYDGWMSIIHDEDRQRVAEELQLAVSNRKDYNTEFRVVWNDSSIHNIKARGTVSRDDDGNAMRMIGVNWDITTEKKIESENKQLTKRLLLATQSAQIGIWDWDIKNNLLTWDEGMYRLYSVAANEFNSVYEGWFSRLHPEDRQKVEDEMQLALDNKKDYKPEFRIVWGDSSVHYINASGIIERDNDGNAIRMIGVNWDITEQKEREQHLKLLESVITNTTDAILITEAEPFDEPGPRILYVNEAFTKMTGYTAEEVIGKTPRILQGPKSDKAELKRLSEAIRRWESCEITTINYKKNGEEFWINFTLTPVANENGWYTHWIAIERDVTVRKNEELQNKLVADISTVFSEPLKLYETLDRTLRFITDFGDFCFAEAWLTSSAQNILKKISSHAATENSRLFLEETISIDISIDGDGFTGAVAKTREITIWGDLANQKQLRRRNAAVKYGLKTIVGLPLLYNNELVGVLVFGLDHELVENIKHLNTFKKLADYLGPEVKRKQLELELNQMFNFAPDLIIIIGLDGRFNRVNPTACELLGYTQQELCAEPYVNFIHPEDREKSTKEIASLLETNLTYYFENRYITKSGKIKWLGWNGIYVAEDNSIYAVAKDITDKKELEKLFKKTNELARIGGWEVDLQNNTILWSDITKEIHEVAQDYIPDLQTGIDFYKEGSHRTRITEYVKQVINNGKSYDDEFKIVTAKGNERWVRAMGEAEFVNGNCTRIYGSFQDIHERKIIEQQKNSLLTTLEKSLNEIYVFDAATLKFSYVNRGALLNNGYSEQEIEELTPLDLMPEFTETIFNQLVNAVVTGEKEKIIFFTNHQRKNRSLYPVEIHLQFVEEANNNKFLAVVLDITERKKAEEELSSAIEKAQESDARFKAYAQQSPIAIYTTDINGDCIYANETWLEIAGMQLEDALGKGWINALHPEDLEFVTDNWYKSIESNGEWNYEYRFINSNKNIIWVNGRAKKLFNDKNEHIGYLGSNINITERKKVESKLIESENYLRTILDNEPECVKVLNNKGELISMNPAGLAMIEADNEQQVLGKRMTDLLHKEYQMGFSQLSAAVFKGFSGTFEFEITGLKGRHRWLETHVVPLKDTTGKIVNLLGVTRDITERKANDSKLILLNENLNRQKIELVTSNKELEQFAYVASHDLQEPLRMVTSFLTLLEKRYVNILDEKGLSYINFAVDGAKRMRQIILDILEFSRINTNHEGKYEYVDLKSIINDISLLQGKLIKEKKAKIIFEELPKVYSMRHYLMQLFQNIISNALKYSKEDIPLEIIIKSKEFDDYYQIAITDNGIGIEQEYSEKIFIIFQRLHGKEKYEGNGMGLAIVKKIVDKLNGKIWVESQIGVGSTFYINIPKKN
jgi:PAS domain S-box-containing protein